jgi:hypothetical protein
MSGVSMVGSGCETAAVGVTLSVPMDEGTVSKVVKAYAKQKDLGLTKSGGVAQVAFAQGCRSLAVAILRLNKGRRQIVVVADGRVVYSEPWDAVITIQSVRLAELAKKGKAVEVFCGAQGLDRPTAPTLTVYLSPSPSVSARA